jgi:hypothetical protein
MILTSSASTSFPARDFSLLNLGPTLPPPGSDSEFFTVAINIPTNEFPSPIHQEIGFGITTNDVALPLHLLWKDGVSYA